MSEKRYRIEHPDGRAYDVSRAAFTKLYEPEGFRITANADGTAVEAPRRSPAKSTRTRSAAAKKGAATRAARAAAIARASARAIDSTAAAGDLEHETDEAEA